MWHQIHFGFSPAVETYSERDVSCVRPKLKIGEALAMEGTSAMNEESVDPEELQGNEAREIPGQKIVYQPTKQEWDDHMRTHFPFRKWCPFCVKGKCRSGAHSRRAKSDEELERENPVISIDYMGPKSKFFATLSDDNEFDSLPILAGIDRRTKWTFAHMVPKKGYDAQAIKMLAREIKLSGYTRLTIKSDQEPSIKALIDTSRMKGLKRLKR